eukprot:8495476-Pyramimonas_sp.AAC.3
MHPGAYCQEACTFGSKCPLSVINVELLRMRVHAAYTGDAPKADGCKVAVMGQTTEVVPIAN